jgi:peptidoglycan/xylan/chitin deacetylase (PgdA/CDA1 family)
MKNFLFHRVNPNRDILWDPMDPILFEKCIKYIKNNYEVVSLEEYILNDEKNVNSNKIATILFDDGYKDNLEYAAPILSKYKCPASFYIITDCIEKNIPSWTHILEHQFLFTKKDSVDFDAKGLPEYINKRNWKNQAEKIAYIKKLKPFLKTISHVERENILSQISQSLNDIELPRVMMSWDDVKQLKDYGFTIGSHTVTHAMLGTIVDENIVKKELNDSGNEILKKLGFFPKTISYPVGSYNETTMRLSKKAGYEIGLAVKQTIHNPSRNNIFEVSRIELYNESWLKTRLRISNQLENIKSLIRYK